MTDEDLCFADATALAALVRYRKVSSVEIVEAHLRRIEALYPSINAVVTLLADSAFVEAKAADASLMAGERTGVFHGIPFSIKDSIDTGGVPTKRGSRLFANHVPMKDATVVARMKDAGAIALMKTNVPEFSMWWETDNLVTGRTNNPWDLKRTPGGSSGGEAAAIAAGLSPIGLGSDVGISVRGPAALTGIVALKATHGRMPCTGLFPGSPARMWHIGPMARSVRDVVSAYHLLNGADGIDGYAIHARDARSAEPSGTGRPIRIGWLVEPGFGPVAAEVAIAVADAACLLSSLGCEVEQVRVPILEDVDCVDLASTLFAEALPTIRAIVAGREEELAPNGKRTVERREPTFIEYVAAEATVGRLKSAFAGYFQHRDVLLCPVVPFTAPRHGQDAYPVDDARVALAQMMRATIPFNITGLPALSVPYRFSETGLPIGVQIIGRWLDEETLFHLGGMIEAFNDVRGRRPSLMSSFVSEPHQRADNLG